MPLKDLNRTDLWFTDDGDFLVDGAGDLRDTRDGAMNFEGLRQAILHRVIGERGAFRLHPDITAGLDIFIGKIIDKQLMEGIQTAVHRALISDGVLRRSDYDIRVLEITPGDVAILIFVNVPGQEHPLVSMMWNVRSGEVTRVL